MIAVTEGTRNSKRADDGSKSVAKARAKGPLRVMSPDAYISDTGGRMGWLVISWGVVSVSRLGPRNKWGPSRESLTHNSEQLSELLAPPVRSFRQHYRSGVAAQLFPFWTSSSFIKLYRCFIDNKRGTRYRISEPPSWPPASFSKI